LEDRDLPLWINGQLGGGNGNTDRGATVKRNPKEQLQGIIRGLRMEEGVPMDELMTKPPKYYEEVGATFHRLSEIGMAELNRLDEEKHNTGDDFQRAKRKIVNSILVLPEDEIEYRLNITKLMDDFEQLVRHNERKMGKGKKKGFMGNYFSIKN
jgi:hypothetical protein